MEKWSEPTNRSLWKFDKILSWHLFENGTRPNGSPKAPGKRWATKTFAHAVASVDRSVRNWLAGRNIPNDLNGIENALFGDNQAYADWRHELRRAFAAAKKGSATADAAPTWIGCPYPGLRSFTPEESSIFVGRENEISELLARLRIPSLGFLTVVGGSGAGKSSLVHAGLLPALEKVQTEENRPVVLPFTPTLVTKNPFAELASKLAPELPRNLSRKPADLAEVLFEEPSRISHYVDALLSRRSDKIELILFIDQFEELFAPGTNPYRDGFIRLLIEATDNRRVRVITTLRAEFLSQCLESELKHLLQQLGAVFPLGRPGKDTLRDMILEPARRAGLDIDDTLANEILEDAGDNPGEVLPLVAFCLEELYRRTLSTRHLTLDAYLEMGRLRGSIARRVIELLADIKSNYASNLDAAFHQIFKRLIAVDAAGNISRQWASLSDLRAEIQPVPKILDALIDGRLLLAENADRESTNKDAVVALAHEALIQEWPELLEWLEQNRSQLQRVKRQLLNLCAHEVEDRLHAVNSLASVHP